jgi:hypothetical protein
MGTVRNRLGVGRRFSFVNDTGTETSERDGIKLAESSDMTLQERTAPAP